MAAKLKLHADEPAAEERLANSLVALAGHRRDAILEAIAMSAKELLRSSDLNASLPRVAERVGQAAGADRLHILLKDAGVGAGDLGLVKQHYVWSAPGISSPPDFVGSGSMAGVGLGSWAPTLAEGEVIVGRTRDFAPSARKLFESAGVKSALAVPIFVEGEWWGIIGFDDCRSEHEWLPAEIDIVKILAELVGAAIVSLRRVQVLADANRIVEASPTIVYRLGPQAPFPLVFVSHNVRRYGYDAEELLAAPERWTQLIHGEDLPAAMANLATLMDRKINYARLEFRLKKSDGAYAWFDGEATPLRDADGCLIALEGIITDITARKEAEQELAASHILLTAAIENSPDAVLAVDRNGQITAFNRHFVDMWNIPPELMKGSYEPILQIGALFMKNEGEFLDQVHALYDRPEASWHDELQTKDGRTVERYAAPLYDSKKKQYLGRIWFLRDITARKTAEQTIVELARTDSLTGLPNRVAFLDRLHLAFARAKRGAGSFTVLYLDLDHFKDINDTLGHPCGDALLKEIADRLKHCVRETDMVSRFGGDEFAVLQEGVTDIAGSEALAEKICGAIAAPVAVEGNQLHTTASIGIVPYQNDIVDPEAMMTKADLALYRAKTDGRDRFRFHIRELDEKVRERVMIGEDLHSAVENDELELYYQPQVELKSGHIVGLEGLIRWNHPQRGLLLPDQFIPVAESNGSILRIGQWVIERTCRQIGDWQALGTTPPVVAANVSAGQFKLASNLDQVVSEALSRYGIAANRLELELTESVLMEATQRHAEEFDRLRGLGVRLAIDDFGTGFSSLDYLRSFRVVRLKIDRRFISGITTNPDDAAIVRAVIGLACALGVEVVAEGVETAEQRAFLTAAGCNIAQGYYFGKPMPVAAATALLRRNLLKRSHNMI